MVYSWFSHKMVYSYKKPCDLFTVYDGLSKNSMRDWFHLNGELKDKYKKCVEFGTYFAKSAQHRTPVSKSQPPNLKEENYTILKKIRWQNDPFMQFAFSQ